MPDREEHFENITVPVDGMNLPIVTPNYYTTAVRIDAIQDYTGEAGISRIAVLSVIRAEYKYLILTATPLKPR